MRGGNPQSGIRRGACAVMAACVLALVVAGANYVIHRPYFDIKTLEVGGETDFIDVDALEHSMRETLRGNYFTADLDALRAKAEAVPWVASARVERVWPDEIRVRLVRRKAVAVWNGTRLLSDRGEVFAPKDLDAAGAQGLPQFSGPDAMAPEVAQMSGELSSLASRLGAEIKALRVTERGSWSARIEGPEVPNTLVELGRETADSRVEERFALVVSHYGEVSRMMGGAPASIDARYVNAFAAAIPTASRMRPSDEDGTAARSAAARPVSAAKGPPV